LLWTESVRAVALQAVPTAKIQKQETQARSKAAAEFAAVARLAASVNALNEARDAYADALAFSPQDEKVKKELEDLKKRRVKKEKPAATALPQINERRTKAQSKAAEVLSPVVDDYATADRSDDLARLVALMRTHRVPVDALIKKYDLVFFEPYYDWRRKKDVERLDAGWELVDGAWCDPKSVDALDATHKDWKNPWRIADEVHELRTTMPLRTARRVLATVASFRGFLLDYLSGEIDLRQPSMKLPIVLTETRDEMDQRMREAGDNGSAPSQAAAFYLASSRPGSPCFVSFEMKGVGGTLTKVDMKGLRYGLLHEVTHQILFEFMKFGADNSRPTEQYPWVEEGLAEFFPNYVLSDGVWVLKYARKVPMAKDSYAEGGFGWCHDHAGNLPPLKEFVDLSRSEMNNVNNYHMACALAAYLLEGKDRAYRPAMCNLATLVHQAREKSDSFESCFKGTDIDALDAEFKAFCRDIKVDDSK
jgi:hypothetical protein